MKSSLLYADGKIVYGCAPKAQEILTHFNNKILHKIITRGNMVKTNISIVKSSLLYADRKIMCVCAPKLQEIYEQIYTNYLNRIMYVEVTQLKRMSWPQL